MKVLFSPVGTADPMTMLGDGPMLHIVRHERPEVVVLYLTQAMQQKEDEEHIYTSALEWLAAETGHQTEVRLRGAEDDTPHRFDIIIPRFRAALEDLSQEFPEAEIILNVSSGTPSMEAALLELDAFGIYDTRAIQVVTPSKAANAPGTREDVRKKYPLEDLWELNPDRKAGAENRCVTVEAPNFKELVVRDNVRALVEKYDYTGAVSILDQQKGVVSQEAERLIRGCDERLGLNRRAVQFFKGTDFSYDPADKLTEYLHHLEVLYLRERWADYLRAMTPALTELFLANIRSMGLRDEDWLKDDHGLRVDVRLAKYNPTVRAAFEAHRLDRVFMDESTNPFVSNSHLMAVLGEQCGESDRRTKLFHGLRALEEAARHGLAHTITTADKQTLDKRSKNHWPDPGLSIDESIKALFDLNPKAAKRGLYTRINQMIFDLL